MELMQKLVMDLEAEVNRVWNEYAELRKEFSELGQKFIDVKPNEEEVRALNALLKDIQDKFGLLNGVYNFIAYRHQPAVNAVNDFNSFIDHLIKAGAVQEDNNDKTIITS